jgi:ribokinase
LEKLKASAIAVQGEVPHEANEAALRYAQSHGCLSCLNPAPYHSNSTILLALARLIVLNETEAGQALQRDRALVASQPELALQDLCQQFPSASIVLTLGAQGAWQGCGPERHYVPASAVNVVDTTAAGDTLTGALLAGLLRSESTSQALLEAVAAAGVCVSRLGAQSSIPFRQPRRQPTIATIR